MKNECSVIKDLLPLYVEDMVSAETAEYIEEHLKSCPECQSELDIMKNEVVLPVTEEKSATASDRAKPFKKMMKRMNAQFYGLAYSLIIFFIFLGFGFTAGENMIYNSLIMPIVGIFGYYVFRWKAVFKMPILLLIIDIFVCLFKLAPISLYDSLIWTVIYSLFVLVGIAIAFLLHFALRKEKKE